MGDEIRKAVAELSLVKPALPSDQLRVKYAIALLLRLSNMKE